MHRSYGFQHLRHKRPRLLSPVKVGIHSAFGEKSHTTAHTVKQGCFGRGWYHYPRSVLHVHKYPRAGYQNGKLCRFWVLAGCTPEGRREPRDSDALMRVAVPRRRGPAGPRDLFTFVEIAACMPSSRYFFRFSRRSSLCRSCASCVSARSFSARSSMVFGRNRQDFLL